MVRTGLSLVLVLTFALRVSAADKPGEGSTPRSNVRPVSGLLEQMAKSPLEPGEAHLLRAVADLLEKEPVASFQRSAKGSSKPVMASEAGLAAVPATQPMAAPKAATTEQPTRLVIRLSHVPAVDIARAVERFLDSEQQKGQRADDHLPSPHPSIFVTEPVSNSLLVSATPQIVDSVTKLISKLDTPPSAVVVKVCIAELLPRSRDGKTDGRSDASTVDKAPSMEKDAAAWLAWAKKQGRLEVLSQPQIMTLDNQPAFLKIDGLTVGATPRISSKGSVVMELDVQRASVLNRDGAAGPTIGKIMLQTTISAKDGQTIIVGGLAERAQNGDRRTTIIAVTPCVMPSREK
jgi:type II secretory pathway component GspD/PulD (secretin)